MSTTTTDYNAAVTALVPDLQYRAEFVPLSQSRNAKEDHPTINWRVTFSRNGRELTTDYGQGVGHLPHYEHRFASLVVYNNAVREACESGKSMLQPGQKNGYDACRADKALKHFAKPIPAPGVADVLHCLLMDADAIDAGSFEEWAQEFGYDTDSRKAETTYRACVEIGLKLRLMLGDELISKLRDALQDM
jgi:hypothetical protein